MLVWNVAEKTYKLGVVYIWYWALGDAPDGQARVTIDMRPMQSHGTKTKNDVWLQQKCTCVQYVTLINRQATVWGCTDNTLPPSRWLRYDVDSIVPPSIQHCSHKQHGRHLNDIRFATIGSTLMRLGHQRELYRYDMGTIIPTSMWHVQYWTCIVTMRSTSDRHRYDMIRSKQHCLQRTDIDMT